MPDVPLYQALANAFVAEGVDTLFVLTGDGNMHWEAAMSQAAGVTSYHVRHEHCACAMATAYASVSGKVGVASVTCGPGLTQIMTALATAASAKIPLVVFAGESPLHASWYNQHIDQAPLVKATGAHYIQAHSIPRALDAVTDAFYFARTRRMPVVLGVPLDMQRAIVSGETRYRTSAELIPDMGPMAPNPAYVARAADRIMAARNIVVLGGRGARMAGAAAACEHLAELCGGLLAETLPVRGLFDRHSRSIGVAGGFSHQVTRQAFAECDLVIAVGASLTHHTVDGGKLFPHATVIQVDANPLGINQGRQIAGIFVRADCKTGLEAIIAELGRAGQDGRRAGWDAEALARRVREEPADDAMVSVEQGLLDPRAVVSALEQALPEDWQYVNASGHCSYFSAQMRGRSADDFLTIREFGAIGNGLCYAVGAAAAKPGQTVVLIDGDGGFLMHVQELETVRRYNLPILACILNDGAFGSEIHKLRADGLDDGGAIFGRGDLGRIARGFGLRGAVVTDVRQVPTVLKDFKAGAGAMVLDCHISDQVVSPTMRRSLLR